MPPLWQLDQDLFRAIHVGLHRDWLDPIMRGLSYSGLGYVQAVPLILAAFMAKLKPSWLAVFVLLVSLLTLFVEKSAIAFAACALVATSAFVLNRATALCSLAALVSSGLVRLVVAQAVARPRPSVLAFSTPLEHVTSATSFPSGHATTTFALVAVLCWRYARTDDAWIAWAALGWGALVAVSRVYVGVHYPLDVLGGAIMGASFGSACYWLWMNKGWMNQGAKAPMARNLS